LNWSEARAWEFFPPDFEKFPLLRLAYEAQTQGGSATCTLNAADEIAVEAFLQERISFPGIWETVEETLARVPGRTPETIGEILEIDRESREAARAIIGRRAVAAVVESRV
jgi:1-deoxy-D-xylulose-5-phosphate reductoisomerase